MPSTDRPIIFATRGSALALAQTNLVLAQCRGRFPELQFEARIIKTTGDKLQTAPPDLPGMSGTKGLFTKELEVAMLAGEADLAVHSLKDLPTDLPEGLTLGAVLPRADVRDVLIYPQADGRAPANGSPQRGLKAGSTLRDFAPGATIATSSTRRQAQVLATRPDLKVAPIRGNVGTRLQKLESQTDLDGLILAAAGLHRLGFHISPESQLVFPQRPGASDPVPRLHATCLPLEEMLPCVGQGAIGIEGRENDARVAPVLAHLNDAATLTCVTAERAFLKAMGGGCLSPVAAYAELAGAQVRLRAVSFRAAPARYAEKVAPASEAVALGTAVAEELK